MSVCLQTHAMREPRYVKLRHRYATFYHLTPAIEVGEMRGALLSTHTFGLMFTSMRAQHIHIQTKKGVWVKRGCGVTFAPSRNAVADDIHILCLMENLMENS